MCKNLDILKPGFPSEPFPSSIKVNILVQDFVDIDWTSNTMTLFIQLWTYWNDSRLAVSTDNAKYINKLPNNEFFEFIFENLQ